MTVSLTEDRNNRSEEKNSREAKKSETLTSFKFKINRIVLASKIAFPVVFFLFNVVYYFVYV